MIKRSLHKNFNIPSRFGGNSFDGLYHGWFGSQRSANSPFGSPFNIFSGLPALDIETTGLSPDQDKILQVGLVDKTALELNINQPRFSDKLSGYSSFAKEVSQKISASGASLESNTPLHKINSGNLGYFQSKGFLTDVNSYLRGTFDEDKARKIVQFKINQIMSNSKNPLVIHNLHFERRFFDAMGIKLPVAEEFWQFTKETTRELEILRNKFIQDSKSISGSAKDIVKKNYLQARFNAQLAGTMNKYNHFVSLVTKGGKGIVDTQVMASAAIGLMQKAGDIPGVGKIPFTGDIFTGTNLEFLGKGFFGSKLKEMHLGTPDAWLSQKIAPKLHDLVGKLNTLNAGKQVQFSSEELGFMKEYQSNQLNLKLGAFRKQLETGLEKVKRTGVAEFERGQIFKSSPSQVLDYFKTRGISSLDSYAAAFPNVNISGEVSKIISEYSGAQPRFSTLKANASKFSRLIPMLAGGAIGGAFLSNLFSGRDDSYNSIEGLRHGWAGSKRKENTHFGSGFKGVFDVDSYMEIQDLKEKMQDPEFKAELKADIKAKQEESQELISSFTDWDYEFAKNLAVLEGINTRKQALQEVKLKEFEILVDDADTIVLKRRGSNDKPIIVRLAGIDAPETGHDDSLIPDPLKDYRINQAQPGGPEAVSRLQELVAAAGDDLSLIIDPSQKTYGRHLGALFNSGKNLNLQLVREGLVSSLEFGSEESDMVARSVFASEGRRAEDSGQGLWGKAFYQNWLSFSKGGRRDLTFNSLTDKVRLAESDPLALAAGVIWSGENASPITHKLGQIYASTGYGRFSAKDDNYNKIEALKHGLIGSSRSSTTDFGSGYIAPDPKFPNALEIYYQQKEGKQDPLPFDYMGLGMLGAGAYGLNKVWNSPVNFFGKTMGISDLSYLGPVPQVLSMGRDKATYGDLAYNLVRRAEYSMGGLLKTFSISSMMSPSFYKSATYELGLLDRSATEYVKYLNELTGKDLIRSGFESVLFQEGKLFGLRGAQQEVILQHARLVQRVHDPLVSKAPSQFGESLVRMRGLEPRISRNIGSPEIVGIDTRRYPLLITGAQTKKRMGADFAHGALHETFSKYLRLMDDPFRVLRDVFSVADTTQLKAEKLFSFLPKLGVGGEAHLAGSVPQLIGRHAKTFIPKALAIPFLYGMADWGVKQLAPDGTAAGDAGITGILAEGAKLAHLTYGRVSDFSGATSVRGYLEDQVKGSTGIAPWFGLIGSGALTGYAVAATQNIFDEVISDNKYDALIDNVGQQAKGSLPGWMRKIPGLRGQYSRAGRYARVGGLIGGALGLPFMLGGLGSDKSYDELKSEYSGQTEVPVYKSRWWEFGMTPWKGESIAYFRPNWYQRLFSDYKDKSIWGGEDLSPLGKLQRHVADPYYLEKAHYKDRPYPITGASGEALGIFGPIYEWTLGRVIKPPMLMHQDQWQGGVLPEAPGLGPSVELGGIPKGDALSPYDLRQQAQQQYYTTYEALGLRGFVGASAIAAMKGEKELFPYDPVLESASDITGARRDFWDLNLGGGLGTTEFLRRLVPRRTAEMDYVNPLQNTMPNWLPGQDYYVDFQTGDPYTKVPEGEYRLPGAGYAARYSELEGINPEDYPVIHQYKILADVAMYSQNFYNTRAKIESMYNAGQLSSEEAQIFETTEEQVELKRQKKEFREASDSMLARYYTSLTDVARANPLEQLTPIAPAHKFLPAPDVLDAYKESIYGKEFKLWEHPYSHFIEPTMTTTANLLGWDGIPADVERRRDTEDYFSKLQYIKAKRLQSQARAQGDSELLSEANAMELRTPYGVDPYDYSSRVLRAIPSRERPYFLEFAKAPEDEKEEILKLAPEGMKDFLTAQWDKEMLAAELSSQENAEMEKEFFTRRSQMRARRKAELMDFMSSDHLPPDNWIGWRSDVDLEDVKLKYLVNEGEDYHYYNLWENRLRTLSRKPYLDDAARYVKIPNEDTDLQRLYDMADQAGIQSPEIQISSGLVDSATVELSYDQDQELEHYLRRGRHIQ